MIRALILNLRRDEDIVGDSSYLLEDPLDIRMEVLERFDRINRVKLSVVEILDDILYRAAVKRPSAASVG